MNKRILLAIVFFLVVPLIYWGCSKEDAPERYTLKVTVTPSGSGTVNPSSGTFDDGEQLSISAIPADGFAFYRWSGDATGNSNPLNFRITSDREFTAEFIKEDIDGDGVANDQDDCPNTQPGQEVDENGCSASQVDTDGDGIDDNIDQCPDTPQGEEVNNDGCSITQLDTDGDGVTDDIDTCPNTPEGEEADEEGCSDSQKDTDGDGVNDAVDTCPNTPAGEEVNEVGCSNTQTDTDGDGVFDESDTCPNTPDGENVDENGCSASQKDTDGDGVTDDKDQCADSPSGSDVDEFGCAPSETDGDGDGVTNDQDQCPNTPGGETVDENGCSDSQKDADGDGIKDNIDECPNTPSGEDTNPQGCSASQRDTDGDGVNDAQDQCVNTPSGESVDAQGCAESQKDSDGDGISDDVDECPGTPSGATVDAQGCSTSQIDSDEDGVGDDLDECPNTPVGETVDSVGCSESQKDSDGDGVNDDSDQCPGTPSGETVDQQGCSDSQKDSDGDGVTDDVDLCADTPSGESVDEDGCSQSQTDKTPPVVTSITVEEITTTSFKVDWSLDEGSKGYIRFGTSPGVYVASTAIENNYLTRHIQTVGGTNPAPLMPGTTYYWQIYVEDQYGNTGFSDEQTTSTLEEQSRTYVPDDVFEQNLIDLGYDDVMDDYVLTKNISSVEVLTLRSFLNPNPTNDFPYELYPPILDYSGLEDFQSLRELTLRQMFGDINNDMIDLSVLSNLRVLKFDETGFNGIDLSRNLSLEILEFVGDQGSGSDFLVSIKNLDLRANMNLKSLVMRNVHYFDDFNLILNRAPSIENFNFAMFTSNNDSPPGDGNVDFTNNKNLRTIAFVGDCLVLSSINLKNGANLKLENIYIAGCHVGDLCIQVDELDHVRNITTIGEEISLNGEFKISLDCQN